MRDTNKTKIIIIIALLISVATLSLGFAAFSSTLTIKSSASVKPNSSTFNVSLSTSGTAVQTGSVTPTTTGATGEAATLTASTISGLKANFTAPGQSVKYSFYAYNAGSFNGYLNSVSIGSKTCTAASGTNQTYVNSACNGISISVKVGTNTYNSSNTNISSHTLNKGASEAVEVTISYAANAAVADGDFSVSFGDTVLTYGSAD